VAANLMTYQRSHEHFSKRFKGEHMAVILQTRASRALSAVMRLTSFVLLGSILWTCANAVPSPRSHVVHEKRAVEPHVLDWTQNRRLESHKVLPMRFGLVQQNMHRLEELLLEVSHPESPKYGQHYTPKQIVDTFAPSAESIGAVMDWLIDSGISRERLRLAANKAWIHVDATVAEAEDILKTEYHVYKHPSGSEQIGMTLNA